MQEVQIVKLVTVM